MCVSGIRDLELLQGTFFSATSTGLIGGLLRGFVLCVHVCVCKKNCNFSRRKMSCTHSRTHILMLYTSREKGKGRRNRKRLSSAH